MFMTFIGLIFFMIFICFEKDVPLVRLFLLERSCNMVYERNYIVNDDVTLSFKEAEEFQKFLSEMDRDSQWIEVEKSKFISISYAGDKDEIIEGLTDESFNDTVSNGTHLALMYDDCNYYIGASALPTLKARAGISGTALEKIKRQDLAEILNKCLPVSAGGTLIRVCGDKVRACHSKNYQPLSQSGIFRTSRATIEGYSNKIFINGTWNHEYMTASWNIYDKDVIDAYVNLFDDMGIPINPKNVQTVVSIRTSDVGTSGATVWYNIQCGKKTVVLGAGLKLNHKGDVSISDFSDNLKDVFASYKKSFYDLEELANVSIKHPVGCIYGLLKKADMPCNLAKETALRFKDGFGNNEIDALKLYIFGVSEVLSVAIAHGASYEKLFTYQEKVARIIGYNFSKFDREAELVDL